MDLWIIISLESGDIFLVLTLPLHHLHIAHTCYRDSLASQTLYSQLMHARLGTSCRVGLGLAFHSRFGLLTTMWCPYRDTVKFIWPNHQNFHLRFLKLSSQSHQSMMARKNQSKARYLLYAASACVCVCDWDRETKANRGVGDQRDVKMLSCFWTEMLWIRLFFSESY